MGKKETRAVKISDALDIPLDTLCDIPHIEILGCNEITVENFRGILDYDENSFKINTGSGIIKVDGKDLMIASVTDESVSLRGSIIKIEFI